MNELHRWPQDLVNELEEYHRDELAESLRALLKRCEDHFAGDFSWDWPERDRAMKALAMVTPFT